ncbi:MAG TPA: cyclic 2,3-diphosphoglycerate synthase [Atribacterota bacterium]|nr:cyclic 2,3-diphosphoglycerate synthase [Atribacterota bacterium]
MKKQNILIMGAAGRDFHNFNVFFRDKEDFKVVAFTAAQIPDIAGRQYPVQLSGPLYPGGIPIFPEENLAELIKKYDIDQVILAYSDLSHQYVMEKASLVLARGADFRLMGPKTTMLQAKVPVVSVCAVRTGSGKSETTRKVASILKEMGKKVVVVRHPMPYGDLAQQIWQRFENYDDLDRYHCTIEEREEYEPHIDMGTIVYAGVDYGVILERAEQEADVIIWDGGNNDIPFYKPDLHIVVTDPLRAGHELTYYPGAVNLMMADVLIIDKIDTASLENIAILRDNIYRMAPDAIVVEAASPIRVEHAELIKGKKVIVIEDGPTLTHGGMPFGAGLVAAQRYRAAEIIDPRLFAIGSIRNVYQKFPLIGKVLPAMGYGKVQIKELEDTINSSDAELVIIGTPIDLSRVMQINKEYVRVKYDLQEIGSPDLKEIILQRLS